MGKSDKRAKSDKINALRKQYEAFLEEDKRRKERNEYILGRLDEMRSCTAVVSQIKPKLAARSPAPLYNSERCVIPLQSSKNMRSYPPSLPSDIPTKTMEETLLLQEIAKKYILIPKRDYYDSGHSVDNNNDWQSKYEILNHIKNIDKEDKIPSHPNEDNEAIYRKEIDQELPVKDISGNKMTMDCTWKDDYKETPKINENVSISRVNHYKYEERGIANVFNTNNLQKDINSKVSNNITDSINEGFISPLTENISIASPTDRKDVLINETPQTRHSNPANQGLKTLSSKIDQKSEVENEEVEQKPDNTPLETSNHQDVAKDFVEPNKNEDEEYPMEMINVSDFTPNVGVKLVDGVNINPEGYHLYESSAYLSHDEPKTNEIETQQMPITQNEVNVEQEKSNPEQSDINNDYGVDVNQDQIPSESVVVESAFDQAGIEEFETEQKDMFYEEHPDENAVYQQEAEGYDSSVNYQQNEYQYYEDVQEQGHPVEINEHEETTELYDPNYEAQYGTAYQQQTIGYVQQQPQEGYEQQPQEGYEQQPGYHQQQGEFNQQQEYVQEQSEYVQQQLQQQGYVQEQPEYVQQEQGYVQEQPEYVQQQQEYVQEQPEYVQQQQEYVQEQPEYVQQQQEYVQEQPEYVQQQQEYVQEQPEYVQQQQEYVQEQPEYVQQQQEYVQEQPEYVQQQQEYVQEQPEYVQQQQEYVQEQPEYVQQPQEKVYDQHQVFDEGQQEPYPQQVYGAEEVPYDQQTGEQQLYDQESYEQLQNQQQHFETAQSVEQQLDNAHAYVETEQIKQEEQVEEVKEKEVCQTQQST